MFFVYLASYFILYGAEIAVVYPKVMRDEYDDGEEAAGRLSLPQMAWRAVRGLFVPVSVGGASSVAVHHEMRDREERGEEQQEEQRVVHDAENQGQEHARKQAEE
jgi:hypothetical protein